MGFGEIVWVLLTSCGFWCDHVGFDVIVGFWNDHVDFGDAAGGFW